MLDTTAPPTSQPPRSRSWIVPVVVVLLLIFLTGVGVGRLTSHREPGVPPGVARLSVTATCTTAPLNEVVVNATQGRAWLATLSLHFQSAYPPPTDLTTDPALAIGWQPWYDPTPWLMEKEQSSLHYDLGSPSTNLIRRRGSAWLEDIASFGYGGFGTQTFVNVRSRDAGTFVLGLAKYKSPMSPPKLSAQVALIDIDGSLTAQSVEVQC